MQRPPRTAAARLPLWTLAVAFVAVALVEPALAGSEEAPEIQDPAGDSGAPAGHDIVAMWIADETVDVPEVGPSLHFQVRVAEDFDHLPAFFAFQTRYRISFVPSNAGGLPAGAVEAYVNILPTVNSTNAVVTTVPVGDEWVSCRFGTAAEAGGSANIPDEVPLMPTFDGATLFGCYLPLSLLGGFGPGDSIASLALEAQQVSRGPLSGGDNIPPTIHETWDRAPDEGFGQDFFFTGGNTTVDPDDTDGDGLNDTCEQQYFGNVTAQNATNDTDSDGLSNGQECALGTDPTKADTDGDGVNDKDDPFPTDPSRGGTSRTSTTSRSTTSRSTTSRSTAPTTTGEPSAAEKLEAEAGYLGMSGGGFLAVLVLCIIGLAVRWSL